MEAIGIIISKGRPEGLKRTEFKGKHCEMVGRARKGESLYAENDEKGACFTLSIPSA